MDIRRRFKPRRRGGVFLYEVYWQDGQITREPWEAFADDTKQWFKANRPDGERIYLQEQQRLHRKAGAAPDQKEIQSLKQSALQIGADTQSSRPRRASRQVVDYKEKEEDEFDDDEVRLTISR